MKKLLGANWFVAMVGSGTYLGTTLFCFNTARLSLVQPGQDVSDPRPSVSESWTFLNPDLDRMIAELKRERDALATREQQLKDLEARLGSERQEIRVAADVVDRIQREFNETILSIRQEEIPNLKKLAKIYTAMSPEGAANILKEQTDEEILKVLFYLQASEAGPILETFGRLGASTAQRAAQLTDRLRRSLENPPRATKS